MGLPTPLARVLDAVQGAAPPRVHQAPAVRWLSVPQLVRTAVDVLQASSFAKYADKRETMATSPREFYRLPAADEEPRDAVFVDYVADTGDGFNATFATARVLSGTADGTLAPDPEFATRGAQADLLVFGGDEVYPVASALQYEQRLNEVLRTAAILDKVVDLPPVMALPGNHDWYDGLASFRRNFCESWVQRDAPPGEELIAVPPSRPARRRRRLGRVPVPQLLRGAAVAAVVAVGGRQPARRADRRRAALLLPRRPPAPRRREGHPLHGDAQLAGGRARGHGDLLRRGRQPALHPPVVHRPRARARRAPPDPARAHRRPAPLRPLHLHRARPRRPTRRRRPTSPSAPSW